MLAHFDRAIEREELRDLARRARRTAADPRSLRSFELIAYHLRTLLHRNDRLGMAASVEARFPFLDSELVKLAINLPYRCKVRLSSALSDGSNPLVAGKWIVRAVADRYLPRELSRMKKKGFKVSAHRRMRIEPDAFADSCIADLFGYSRAELAFLMEHASDGLKQRLLQLSVWGDLFLRRETVESALVRLRRRVSMARAAPDARVSAGARDPAA